MMMLLAWLWFAFLPSFYTEGFERCVHLHTVIPHTLGTIFHQDSTNPPGKVLVNHFNISRRRTLPEPVSRAVFSFSSVSGLREVLQNAEKAFYSDFFRGLRNVF